MSELRIRCSSLGKIMTEPKTAKEGPLSVGAKTYIRSLVAQDIFGVDFEVSSKQMEKGIMVEPASIDLLNRVRGLSLGKNQTRMTNGWITGECDLFDDQRKRGHDVKSSWSAATFPIAEVDCVDKLYEWQMRGYMWLWDADEWEVNYCLVNTPEHLIGFEPVSMHFFDHIPEHMRVTTWAVTRDKDKELLMAAKVEAARDYYAEVVAEFERTHIGNLVKSEIIVVGVDVEVVEELTFQPGASEWLESLTVDDMAGIVADSELKAAQVLTEGEYLSPAAQALNEAEGAVRFAKAHTPPTLALGEISTRLGFNVTSAFLATLGFEATTMKAAKLFHEADFPLICRAIVDHIYNVCQSA